MKTVYIRNTDCHLHGNGLLCGQKNYSSNTPDHIKCFRDLDKKQLSSLLDNYLTVTCKGNKRFNKILENTRARNAILKKIKEEHNKLKDTPSIEIYHDRLPIDKNYLHYFYTIIDRELDNKKFRRRYFSSTVRRIISNITSKKSSSSSKKNSKSKK